MILPFVLVRGTVKCLVMHQSLFKTKKRKRKLLNKLSRLIKSFLSFFMVFRMITPRPVIVENRYRFLFGFIWSISGWFQKKLKHLGANIKDSLRIRLFNLARENIECFQLIRRTSEGSFRIVPMCEERRSSRFPRCNETVPSLSFFFIWLERTAVSFICC